MDEKIIEHEFSLIKEKYHSTIEKTKTRLKKLIRKKKRILSRLAIDNIRERKYKSRNKFFHGMYAEYSGLVISEAGYMKSSTFNNLLEDIKTLLDENVNMEHHLYAIGKSFLDSKIK